MIDIQDVKRLCLGPNDVLVIQTNRMITREMRDAIEAEVAKGVPGLAGRLLVIDTSITLSIVSVDAAERSAAR